MTTWATQLAAIRAEFESDIKETELVIAEEKARDKAQAAGVKALAKHREVSKSPAGRGR